MVKLNFIKRSRKFDPGYVHTLSFVEAFRLVLDDGIVPVQVVEDDRDRPIIEEKGIR